MYRIAVGLLALLTAAGVSGCVADSAAAPDVPAVVEGNTRFALDLYGRLRAREGNLFFSPYSISAALAMTSAGARGETADEMAKVLHLSLGAEKLAAAEGALDKQINGEGQKRGYQLRTANALWGQKGFAFRPDFLKLTKDGYEAPLREVDFAGATEEARKTINAWVEKQTEDKIKDLLKKGVLNVNTRLVLTNAIYFKGDWQLQFKKDWTRDGPFKVGGDKTVQVPFMNQTERFGYLDAPGLQLLEMPYAGKELSMVVLLPKKADGLAALEKDLTVANLERWLKGAREQKVAVSLPRFKLTAEFDLNKVLSEMGMPSAFGPSADFSGMGGSKGELYLSAVVHKAFVDVNEQGTEAAAATAVVVDARSAPVVPVFRADHPFVFLIRDKRSGSVLFLGRLASPS
jgi:serpin B